MLRGTTIKTAILRPTAFERKGAADPALIHLDNLSHFSKLRAGALARTHARTSDSLAITGSSVRAGSSTVPLPILPLSTWIDLAALAAAASNGRLTVAN